MESVDTLMEHGDTDPLQNRINAAVLRLVDMNINFMALDFDLTVIDEHTGGRWKGTPKELAEHVRPIFKTLIESALLNDINVAIVTFSGQTQLISEVLKLTFPDAPINIPIRGGYDPANGKQNHLALATKDLEKIAAKKGTPSAISGATTVLIDDDGRNIRKALRNGYHGVHFNPDDPIDLLRMIMDLKDE